MLARRPAQHLSAPVIIDRHRAQTDPRGRRRDCGQQARLKRQQGSTIADRSFGKKRHRLVTLQPIKDRFRLIVNCAALGAFDVNRVVLVGKPAQE